MEEALQTHSQDLKLFSVGTYLLSIHCLRLSIRQDVTTVEWNTYSKLHLKLRNHRYILHIHVHNTSNLYNWMHKLTSTTSRGQSTNQINIKKTIPLIYIKVTKAESWNRTVERIACRTQRPQPVICMRPCTALYCRASCPTFNNTTSPVAFN